MERPFWDNDNLPMITLYLENAVMHMHLAFRFNAALTGRCCSCDQRRALLPMMGSIAR